MKVLETRLADVKIIEPEVFGDHRGFFSESYNEKLFSDHGIAFNFVQDNHSLSKEAGIIRGLHYQLSPMAQTKLIRAVTGSIYDVAVDIRKGSPTYGEWVGVILSEDNHRQLLVPKGFAHGFCTISSNVHVLYKVDAYYSKENDRGILWNDPEISIEWPISAPILSEKDTQHPQLKEAEIDFRFEGR